jgi:Putative transposase, YhgA-like
MANRIDHDSAYRLFFSLPEVVRDLVHACIDDEWLQGLDFTSLEKIPATYVSDDLRQRSGDVVWRVKVNETWVHVYLLIEFQSTIDPMMAVRMMTYCGLLWQDLERRDATVTAGDLPPILPIVLYNGEHPWSAATDVADMLSFPPPGLISTFRPSFKHLVIDEAKHAAASAPMAERNLVAAMFQIEHPGSIPDLITLISKLLPQLLKESPRIANAMMYLAQNTFAKRPDRAMLAQAIERMRVNPMTLHEKLDEWEAEKIAIGKRIGKAEGEAKGKAEGEAKGKAEGEAIGIREGQALALKRFIAKRFGSDALTRPLAERIDAADLQHIEQWLDRAYDASSLGDVFETSQ